MATKTDIPHILGKTPDDGHLKIAKTKIVCTLGPKSREVPVLEKLLHAGMNVARFNFSHGSHEYQQYTLNNLRQAMVNTQIMCAVLLDTKVQEFSTTTVPSNLLCNVGFRLTWNSAFIPNSLSHRADNLGPSVHKQCSGCVYVLTFED